MNSLFLTASTTFIIGPIAKLFGWIMTFIYDKMHLQNVGWDIVLLAFIVYMLTLPLTIKQQKFSKLSAVMNPEIQAVQKKYAGKRDNESVARMQAETKEIQAKYGVKTSTGCIPTLIQLPILWALYQVIYKVPAYLKGVRAIYENTGIIKAFQELPFDKVKEFASLGGIKITDGMTSFTDNQVIDMLWKFQSKNWETLKDIGANVNGFVDKCDATLTQLKPHITFLGLSIAESPLSMMQAAWADKNVLGILLSLVIPVLAGLTQWLNTKLMPQQANADGQDSMANTMKTMNIMMPLMSIVFCFSLPSGIGIYWIIGAVYRSIQQILINRLYLSKLDLDAEIAKNMAKYEEEKKKAAAVGHNRDIVAKSKANYKAISYTDAATSSAAYDPNKYKPGSMAAKANMVAQYNDRVKKGKK